METRINRILDETRRIPKALGRVGWSALIACAVPLIYFTTTAQLAPAQTLMPIPAPGSPQPPRLLAQAAAPAPTPQAAPAPAPRPEPPDADSGLEHDIQGTIAQAAAQIRSLEMQLVDEEAQLRREQTAGSPEQIQARQAEAEAARRELLAQQAMLLQAQLEQLQAQVQSQRSSGSQLTVEVSPERAVRLSFPLAENTEYDVTVQILDQNNSVVAAARDRFTGLQWTAHFSLKAGTYHFHGIFRKTSDNAVSTRDAGFEVH